MTRKSAKILNPSNLSKSDVYEIARMFAEKFKLSSGEDLRQIVQKMNGTIEVGASFEDNDASGTLFINKNGSFSISIPDHTSIERDRFTIAHEIGHYILHYIFNEEYKNEECYTANRSGSSRIEWEANWFASELLMPEKEFRAAYDDLNKNLYEISKKFGTSELACSVRAKSLGLDE
ncbi:ImmA/IrrE family metallo-endopeptidase [Acetobacter persici]|nr:ImmA/IrrE family metallo-endopeptidase [Acetobacter persici]